MSELILGLDLGGTKICGVVVDGDGRVVVGPQERPTERERSPEAILDSVAEMIEDLRGMASSAVGRIGVGIPSTLDVRGGMVPCPNLPTLGGVDLQSELQRRLHHPVVMDNDANCYAYGEWRSGAGRGADTCCCLTLGTGLGMGIILRGELYRGRRGSAGELCYSPYQDGRSVEDIVSGPGISRRYEEMSGVEAGPPAIAAAARRGDDRAREVWREVGDALGFALAYAVNILDPEIVVLGGSLTRARDLFDPAMEAVLERHAYQRDGFQVKSAELDGHAAAVGAALLAREANEDTRARAPRSGSP